MLFCLKVLSLFLFFAGVTLTVIGSMVTQERLLTHEHQDAVCGARLSYTVEHTTFFYHCTAMVPVLGNGTFAGTIAKIDYPYYRYKLVYASEAECNHWIAQLNQTGPCRLRQVDNMVLGYTYIPNTDGFLAMLVIGVACLLVSGTLTLILWKA